MEGKGAIIALGYEFTLDTIRTYNHEDTLNKLKALGDETRLRIIELILEKSMSASELSKTLDLTIPTIAHHLRVLTSAGIIKTFIEEEGGAKTTYKIYSLGLDDLISNISFLNSGDIK
jgi:DNA-binding transcriptional ArsR family regulator